MRYGPDAGILQRLGVFSKCAAAVSVVIGLSVLVGWTLDIPALLTWGDGTAMAPNAAACMIFAGLSLWLQSERHDRSFPSVSKMTARALAALVSVAGLLTLGEYIFGPNLRIDRLLLLQSPGPSIVSARTLMSPVAAGAYLLLGLALLGIDWRTKREHWPAQYLCLVSGMVPVFGLLSLVLGPQVSSITLALPAVVGFLALTFGLLCSHPSWAMGGILTRRSPGAKLLRVALPVALLVSVYLAGLFRNPC